MWVKCEKSYSGYSKLKHGSDSLHKNSNLTVLLQVFIDISYAFLTFKENQNLLQINKITVQTFVLVFLFLFQEEMCRKRDHPRKKENVKSPIHSDKSKVE